MKYIIISGQTTRIAHIDFIDKDLLIGRPHRICGSGYAWKGDHRIHRMVLERKIGYKIPKGFVVDHKNGVRLDNRRENLRLCTVSENNRNVRKVKGTSIYKGVSWRKSHKKWQALIRFNKKLKFLGLFDDEKEAAKAYNKAAIILHGDFSRINNL